MPRLPGKTARLIGPGGRAARAVLSLLAALPAARAGETPVLAVAPAERAGATPETRPWVTSVESAAAAGLPTLVEGLGEEALRRLSGDEQARRRVLLAMATARLQRSDFTGARQALAGIPGESPEKRLRLGLAAYGEHRTSEARSHLAAVRAAALPAGDALWREALEGLIAGEDARPAEVEAHFRAAAAKARDPQEKAQMSLLRLRTLLRMRPQDTNAIDEIGRLIDILPDIRQTYQLAKVQAFALHREGRAERAVHHLRRIPVRDADLVAERELLCGLMAGDGSPGSGGRSPAGREALLRAVKSEGFPDIQGAALAALREAVLSALPGEVVVNANAVYARLTELVEPPTGNPDSKVADLAHYTRAVVMLAASSQADSDAARDAAREKAAKAAQDLLEKFPGSPLREDALALTADIAWQSGAFRKAADALDKLRELSPAGESVALDLAAADCYFLNRDHALAAAAYARARQGLSDETARGEALIGEIRARLADTSLPEARRADDAARALDAALAPGGRIAPGARLRAEWLVSEALRKAGDAARALPRVQRALEATPEKEAGMRVRLLWLRAMVELACGMNRNAAESAQELTRIVSADAPGEVRENAPAILAQTALLKARAMLAAGGDAQESLRELREKHAKQPSAAASYLVEGRHLSAQGRHAEAFEVFRQGHLRFREEADPALAQYAVAALYEAACEALTLADRQGPVRLKEAFDLLDVLTKEYPRHELFFRARLMQGDILRRRNEFDSALKVYEDLVASHPNHPSRIRAEMAKADCLLKQGKDGDRRAERLVLAAAEYERLVNLPGRPADLAAEAACKRAEALSLAPTKGAPNPATGARLARAEAAKTLWVTIDELLTTPEQAAALGDNGRHWVAYGLLKIAELREQDGLFAEARAALNRLLQYNAGLPADAYRLPGSALAKRRLDSLSGRDADAEAVAEKPGEKLPEKAPEARPAS